MPRALGAAPGAGSGLPRQGARGRRPRAPGARDHTSPRWSTRVMDFYVTSHFSNQALRNDIKASDLGESKSIAVMLSRIGEYDARRLFVEDGYPSMRAYCMGELRYSEPEASKRICAARTARKLPV